MPYFESSFSKILEIKWEPPSLITTLGIPNRGKIAFLNHLSTTRVSFVGAATTSIHFDT